MPVNQVVLYRGISALDGDAQLLANIMEDELREIMEWAPDGYDRALIIEDLCDCLNDAIREAYAYSEGNSMVAAVFDLGACWFKSYAHEVAEVFADAYEPPRSANQNSRSRGSKSRKSTTTKASSGKTASRKTSSSKASTASKSRRARNSRR